MVVQVFVLAKNQADRIEQHVAAIPMLQRLHELCVDTAEEGTCWYREEPGYRGSQYSMTLVSKQPKGGAVKGQAASGNTLVVLASTTIDNGVILSLPPGTVGLVVGKGGANIKAMRATICR